MNRKIFVYNFLLSKPFFFIIKQFFINYWIENNELNNFECKFVVLVYQY